MEKKTRLGRGLDALIGGADEPAAAATALELAHVAVGDIDNSPFQPRRAFDDDELASLSASIRTHGILQPLVVRQIDGRFQLVAGERRLRAARSAGLAAVPVRVVDFDDQQVSEAALVENIQRSDLNPVEKAQGFKDYLGRFGMTHEQLAGRLGLARSTITNLVALLDLPAEVQDLVRIGALSTGHAKLLKGVADRERLVAVAKEAVARGLSVHATEALIKAPPAEEKADAAGEPKAAPGEKTAHVRGVEDELRQRLGMRVEIKVKAKDRGQVVLAFESNDDFERLVEVLRR